VWMVLVVAVLEWRGNVGLECVVWCDSSVILQSWCGMMVGLRWLKECVMRWSMAWTGLDLFHIECQHTHEPDQCAMSQRHNHGPLTGMMGWGCLLLIVVGMWYVTYDTRHENTGAVLILFVFVFRFCFYSDACVAGWFPLFLCTQWDGCSNSICKIMPVFAFCVCDVICVPPLPLCGYNKQYHNIILLVHPVLQLLVVLILVLDVMKLGVNMEHDHHQSQIVCEVSITDRKHLGSSPHVSTWEGRINQSTRPDTLDHISSIISSIRWDGETWNDIHMTKLAMIFVECHGIQHKKAWHAHYSSNTPRHGALRNHCVCVCRHVPRTCQWLASLASLRHTLACLRWNEWPASVLASDTCGQLRKQGVQTPN